MANYQDDDLTSAVELSNLGSDQWEDIAEALVSNYSVEILKVSGKIITRTWFSEPTPAVPADSEEKETNDPNEALSFLKVSVAESGTFSVEVTKADGGKVLLKKWKGAHYDISQHTEI